MFSGNSQASITRGADGRLYAISAGGVKAIHDSLTGATRATVRAGDRVRFDSADHEAARTQITPGGFRAGDRVGFDIADHQAARTQITPGGFRAGDRVGFDVADHQAARTQITPGM